MAEEDVAFCSLIELSVASNEIVKDREKITFSLYFWFGIDRRPMKFYRNDKRSFLPGAQFYVQSQGV